MCAPTDGDHAGSHTTKHVVVVGAGPAGLLLTNGILNRNNQKQSDTAPNSVTYRVTLLDTRIDVGMLDVETDLKKYRSWMIGLAGHGLEAIRTVPGLWEDYVSQPHVGAKMTQFSLFLGSKEMKFPLPEGEGGDAESHLVDRNFVVASMARYMEDNHGSNPLLQRTYETTLQYVDSENRRVLIRNKDGQEDYLNYDLLVGADGARSVVRDSFVRDVYDFETDFGDIFNDFKAVHVQRPEAVCPSALCILPDCLPNMTGIVLAMPGGKLSNISIGCTRNNFDKIAPELKSDDVKVVADYFRKNFKAFQLIDYEDFAAKWVGSGRWNRTSMVHCNQYHNMKACAVIMGDAAHATSPSIGMGMNTALRDAQKFMELLEHHEDNLHEVLPAFSKLRVPEGNSLTDLAFHLSCLDTRVQGLETLHMVVRGQLHKYMPWLFSNHPQAIIGHPKVKLADVYKLAIELNVIPKHRAINDRIRQEYFERQVGMRDSRKGSGTRIFVILGIVGALVGAFSWQVLKKNQ